MDAINVQILTELMSDAQIPFSHIAKKIGMSHETVRKRYERMKEEGTIKQCTVLVDGHKLGDEGTAFLMLSCASEANKKDVLESLKLIPDLYMIVDVIGDYDFFTWARLENIEKLARLVGSIRSLGNIDRVETILLTQTYFAFSLAPKVAIKCNGMDLPRKP